MPAPRAARSPGPACRFLPHCPPAGSIERGRQLSVPQGSRAGPLDPS